MALAQPSPLYDKYYTATITTQGSTQSAWMSPHARGRLVAVEACAMGAITVDAGLAVLVNAVTVASVTQTASGSTTGQQTALVFSVAPPTLAPGDTVQFKSNVGAGTAANPLLVTFVVREATI
jgi:plastocyanin